MNEYERGSGGMILTGETEVPEINNVFQCHLVPRHTLRGMVWVFFVSLKFGQTSESQTRACHTTPLHSTRTSSRTHQDSTEIHNCDYIIILIFHRFTFIFRPCYTNACFYGSFKGPFLALPVHAL